MGTLMPGLSYSRVFLKDEKPLTSIIPENALPMTVKWLWGEVLPSGNFDAHLSVIFIVISDLRQGCNCLDHVCSVMLINAKSCSDIFVYGVYRISQVCLIRKLSRTFWGIEKEIYILGFLYKKNKWRLLMSLSVFKTRTRNEKCKEYCWQCYSNKNYC